MCRIGAIKGLHYVHPSRALKLMESQQKGHDNSIALGANGVFTGKMIVQMAGCIGNDMGCCNACNTGLCPVRITTQEPALVHRLDPEKVAQNIVNYFLAMGTEFKELMAPIGNSSLPVGRSSDALVAVDKSVADKQPEVIPTRCMSKELFRPRTRSRFCSPDGALAESGRCIGCSICAGIWSMTTVD
ncbi:MAG: glutamate synthase-related protein [Desulfuromonadales bacterium]|nr:glutamate synthase-related protein [Desulfuromonadales bacterium]MDT8423560.1 glutamate synthase-related protein [Desulfuromonadales bacterium]